MDPGVISLAPTTRLSPQATHVFVDLVLGGWLLVAIGVATLLAYLAWQQARRLGAEVWKQRGLRSGPILLPGVAQPLEDDPRKDGTSTPFVELTIEQQGQQRQAKGGPYVVWSEASRSLSERPFELRTQDGERVRVEPSGRIDLVDRLDTTERVGKDRRRRIARIVQGEEVWVRGELFDTGLSGSGPYRAGGASYRWALRPSSRQPMFISSQPVEAEGRAESRLHRRFAYGFLGFLVFCQAFMFSDFRALRSDGVVTQAMISKRRTWTTRNKNSTTTHYGLTLAYDPGDGRRETEQETNRTAYGILSAGDRVPIVYARSTPSVMQLGNAGELGISDGQMIFGLVVGGGLTIFYLVLYASRLPWWRRKKLVETTKGAL